MDKLETQTATPQEEAYFPPAPHGLRAAAWLIDYVIVMLVVAIMPQPVRYFLPLALFIAYHTVLIWLVQQTIGKALLGLRVERNGKKPGFLRALGRVSLGYFIVDVLGIGLLTALFNQRHRCLHDYVFGTVVVFQGGEEIRARNLLVRLSEFAEKQKEAVAEKKKAIAALTALWAFLAGLARTLQKAIDFLAGLGSGSTAPGPATSVAGALSLKAAAVVTVAATAISATVVTYVPPVRYTAEWLMAPRYFLVKPPPGWIKCSCPKRHSGIGAFYGSERWHQAGISCSQAFFSR